MPRAKKHTAEEIIPKLRTAELEIANVKPDIIVSDIGMPGMDGYEFMRTVRKMQPVAEGRIPAIALTAFARSEDRTKAMLAGYQVHMAKPLEAQELAATISNLVGRSVV